MSVPLHITNHALDRYQERFGGVQSLKSIEKRKNTIRKVVSFGMKVKPKDGFMVYLRNRCKDVDYYVYRNIVAVVDNRRVVTVYNHKYKEWETV